MAFISLLLLWPLLLAVSLLELLKVALPVISWALLVWNILVLIVLLVIRYLWKKSGTMSRDYLDALGGWKRVLLLILKYGLLVLIVWEVLLVLASAGLVIWGAELLELLL